MKTLSTVLREEKITRRGDILEFIKNAELIGKNKKDKLDTEDVKFRYTDSNSSFSFGKYNLYASDILVVSTSGNSIDYFLKKLKKLDNQIIEIEKEKQDIKNKINFLKESGSEKYNDKEYRAYVVIKIIESGTLNDFDKAKVISELMK